MRNTPTKLARWIRTNRNRYFVHSVFSSVLSSQLLQSLVFIALLAASYSFCAFQFSATVYDNVKPSILRITCGDKSATGFLWSSSDTAVTALHVVSGCGDIHVYYESARVLRAATIAKVHHGADLALLKITNAPAAHILEAEKTPPSLTEELSILGYPLQTTSMSSTRLQLRYGGKTLRDIVPESVQKALSGGSPSLALEIDNIEGHLLPGHSGAPIFDQQGKIVAIADGGLENGAAAISWGIPVKFLGALANSTENITPVGGPTASAHALLFAAETETRNMGESTCSGLTLTKLRTASFAQVSKTVDDPIGLLQLMQFFQSFNVDPGQFNYDIYQHLPSGATFVLPAGVQLTQDSNGACAASLPSGLVQMHLRLGAARSVAEAGPGLQAFELSMSGGDPQNWMGDPQWTNLTPYTRFDGLVFRRRAYTHFQTYPVMVPDKYLFETLAVRSNVFIASATTYSVVPGLPQQIAICNYNAAAPGCDQIRQFSRDWVQSVLAIQLTTFPVG